MVTLKFLSSLDESLDSFSLPRVKTLLETFLDTLRTESIDVEGLEFTLIIQKPVSIVREVATEEY